MVETNEISIVIPKRRVPIAHMLSRLSLSGILLSVSALGAYTTTIDKSAGDAILGLIFYTLSLGFWYATSSEVQDLQLDLQGFTYRNFLLNERVAWSDVTRIAAGRVFRDETGLVLVSRRDLRRTMSISGYFDVSGEDLATAMNALATASKTNPST